MSEIEAAKAIETFFEAFNAHDGEAHLNIHHFPHIRINDQGQVRIVQNASEYRPLDSVLAYLNQERRMAPQHPGFGGSHPRFTAEGTF